MMLLWVTGNPHPIDLVETDSGVGVMDLDLVVKDPTLRGRSLDEVVVEVVPFFVEEGTRYLQIPMAIAHQGTARERMELDQEMEAGFEY